MRETLNLSALPSSIEELDEQIFEAFSPEPEKTSENNNSYVPPSDDGPEYTYEYIPPDDEMIKKCRRILEDGINPSFAMLGLSELSENELDDVSEAWAGAGIEAKAVFARNFSKLLPEKMNPLTASILTAGAVTGWVMGKRAIEHLFFRNLRNVTPQPDPQNPPAEGAQPTQEENPVYG